MKADMMSLLRGSSLDRESYRCDRVDDVTQENVKNRLESR
jgi:hypothetical protein